MSDNTRDPDAVEIGELYRKAKEAIGGTTTNKAKVIEPDEIVTVATEGTVTPIRHFSGRMSGSRNANRTTPREGTNGWYSSQPASGDVCYYCRERFSPGQTRYRITEGVDGAPQGWGPALLCMACFKETDDSYLGLDHEGNPCPRHTKQCAGCGESINTIVNPRHLQWEYCSNRCYQRDYRKRRRGSNSVVEWKGRRPNNTCAVCKKPLDRYDKQHKRKDAVYCSPKCRQWAYRRRSQR